MTLDAPHSVGRYSLFGEIASGGMATVCFGRALGPHGFARTVAVKRLLPSLARERDFVDMFVDEARLAARISHPNVVTTLDVVSEVGELLVVMEYVPGESLSRLHRELRRRRERVPMAITCAVTVGFLDGLHAAHEAKSDRGEPLGLVHRDVSPQNVLVGTDGVARVLDFGIAKAAGRLHTTRDGRIKGKIAYMAPEQMRGERVDRRTDVYAAGVVLWELLTGKGLFHGESDHEVYAKVMAGAREPPSVYAPEVPPPLDRVVMQALSLRPADRFVDARAMAEAIEDVVGLVSARRVGEWVQTTAADALSRRAAAVRAMEAQTSEPGTAPSPARSRGGVAARAKPRSLAARAPASAPAGGAPAEASTLPQVHVSAVRKPSPKRELSLLWVAAAAFLSAGGLALGIGLARAPAQAPPAEVGEARSSNASDSPRHARGAPEAPVSLGPTLPITLASGSSEVRGPPPPAAPREPSALASTAPSASTRPRPRAPAPRCDPPWVMGPDGIKRIKEACL